MLLGSSDDNIRAGSCTAIHGSESKTSRTVRQYVANTVFFAIVYPLFYYWVRIRQRSIESAGGFHANDTLGCKVAICFRERL